MSKSEPKGVPEFCQYDFRQLDIRQWRKSGGILAKVQWTLANWRKFDGLLSFFTEEYKCGIRVTSEDVRRYLVAFNYQCD